MTIFDYNSTFHEKAEVSGFDTMLIGLFTESCLCTPKYSPSLRIYIYKCLGSQLCSVIVFRIVYEGLFTVSQFITRDTKSILIKLHEYS